MKTLTGEFFLEFKGPHVYVWRRGKEILYIGSSTSPLTRITNNHHRIRLLPTDTVEFVRCENAKDMLLLESRLIKQHSPRYNGVLRTEA
jgi:excinuclease UvrABC nuclease subunit